MLCVCVSLAPFHHVITRGNRGGVFVHMRDAALMPALARRRGSGHHDVRSSADRRVQIKGQRQNSFGHMGSPMNNDPAKEVASQRCPPRLGLRSPQAFDYASGISRPPTSRD
eukprot:scaffold133398_cov95-Phaeocystis_antarctica.AAC.1